MLKFKKKEEVFGAAGAAEENPQKKYSQSFLSFPVSGLHQNQRLALPGAH